MGIGDIPSAPQFYRNQFGVVVIVVINDKAVGYRRLGDNRPSGRLYPPNFLAACQIIRRKVIGSRCHYLSLALYHGNRRGYERVADAGLHRALFFPSDLAGFGIHRGHKGIFAAIANNNEFAIMKVGRPTTTMKGWIIKLVAKPGNCAIVCR